MIELLRFRAGKWVEVRSEDEILATLDEYGRLEGMPFMPEMLQYCGRRFRIGKTAHKTCDTIVAYVARRLERSVHLEDLRCDGAAHGGCQAACLLFWKHAWLRPVGSSQTSNNSARSRPITIACNRDALQRAVHIVGDVPEHSEELWACQATELIRSTTPLRWWDIRQYLHDLLLGNVRFTHWVRFILLASFNSTMRLRWPWRQIPRVEGLVKGKTPSEVLNLQAGEWVEVKEKPDIMATLAEDSKNRGLWFDVEMLPHCGKRYQVLQRVERIIDEKSGRLIPLPGGCIMLDRTTCSGNYSRNRLFCPRAIHSYWREIWLRRVD